MPDAKVQVVFTNTTGLPADAFVNTLHFNVSAFTSVVGNAVALRLSNFYNTTRSTGRSVAEYLGNCVARGLTDGAFRMYDELDNDLPPWFETTWDPGPAGGASDLPWEVACCLSFKNTSVTTTPERRRRGRIYIGPLNTIAQIESGGSVRPHGDFQTTLLEAAQDLFDGNDATATWQVWSKAAADGFTIEEGWVDNAFDTQRRRGEAVTARSSVIF